MAMEEEEEEGKKKKLRSQIDEVEWEEKLIAAVEKIVVALESGGERKLTNETKDILSELGSKLSSFTSSFPCPQVDLTSDLDDEDEEEEEYSVKEEEVRVIEKKLRSWEETPSMIYDHSPLHFSNLLHTLHQTHNLLTKTPEITNLFHSAMARVEDELRNILSRTRQPFHHHISFREDGGESMDDASIVSSGEEASTEEDSARAWEEVSAEVVHPAAIPDIRRTVRLMCEVGYGGECSRVFVVSGREAVEDCLRLLQIQKLGMEEVLRMEWQSLNSKIKHWVWAVGLFFKVYLPGEKRFLEQVFVDLQQPPCFLGTTKSAVLLLFNFGEAVAIALHKPEQLFALLDMYEVLSSLLPDIDALYPGTAVASDCRHLLRSLSDSVGSTFRDFERAVGSVSPPGNPFPGGGVHHLTKYVMNYVRNLADYIPALSSVFAGEKASRAECGDGDGDEGEGGKRDGESAGSPGAAKVRSLVGVLEGSLEFRSGLYKEVGLKHLFLMNNKHYMAEKVKEGGLRVVFGDKWVRKRNGEFQQEAMKYERATWGPVLSVLRGESRGALRDFYAGFEEVYRVQTGWIVRDAQLREELRISTALKVVQACRVFVGRHGGSISEKHIKYTPDDLQNYIMDLFEGSHKSLPTSRR